jgi:DNA-directed RNA polymerase specialized sigma24 family protein
LIDRALSADPRAFDELASCLRSRLQPYTRRHARTLADADDALQNTLLAIIRALGAGRYTHINEAAFLGWVYKIAHREIMSCGRSADPPGGPPVPLEAAEYMAAPDPAPSVETEGERHGLLDLLNRELDAALVFSERTDHGRNIGMLKKLAFVEFYVDERTIREIHESVCYYAQMLEPGLAVSAGAVNNWLARGDVLRVLVGRLVESHRDLLSKLADSGVYEALEPDEFRALTGYWEEGKDVPSIAAGLRRSEAEVVALLRDAKRVVVLKLGSAMKQQLHEMRYWSST